MPVIIRNRSIEPQAIPYPFNGILKGRAAIQLDMTLAQVRALVPTVLDGFDIEERSDITPFDTGYGPVDSDDALSTNAIDLYLSAANGNDANDGLTPATAVATLARLNEVIPPLAAGHVRLHGGSGTYTWVGLKRPTFLYTTARMWLVGDGAGQAGEDGHTVVATGVAGVGTGTQNLTLQAATTTHAYRGRTLTCRGAYRTIQSNTTTNVRVGVAITGMVAGDAYRVLEPSMRISLPVGQNSYVTDIPIEGFQFLGLVNVCFEGAAGVASTRRRLAVRGSTLACFGVCFDAGAFYCQGSRFMAGSWQVADLIDDDLGAAYADCDGWSIGNFWETEDWTCTQDFWSSTADIVGGSVHGYVFESASVQLTWGSAFYQVYGESSTIFVYGDTGAPYEGFDIQCALKSCWFDFWGCSFTEQTWGGSVMWSLGSTGWLRTEQTWVSSGGADATLYQAGGAIRCTSAPVINWTKPGANSVINLREGASFALGGPPQLTGKIVVEAGCALRIDDGITLTGGIETEGDVVVYSSTSTINSSAQAYSPLVCKSDGKATFKSGTTTLTAGTNKAYDLREGGQIILDGGSVTCTSSNTTATGHSQSGRVEVRSGTLTSPNSSSGVGLLCDGASVLSQYGGTINASTTTSTLGGCVARGTAQVACMAGTFTATAGTGTGPGFSCTKGARAHFEINPTCTGGSGGGVGMFARTGHVTLTASPTNVNGSTPGTNDLQVDAAAVGKASLTASFSSISASNGSIIARAS